MNADLIQLHQFLHRSKYERPLLNDVKTNHNICRQMAELIDSFIPRAD